MADDHAQLVDAIDEYGGFLAGYRDWWYDQDPDDRPGPRSVLDTVVTEYWSHVEVVVGGQREGESHG
jgi:hypothetical protein